MHGFHLRHGVWITNIGMACVILLTGPAARALETVHLSVVDPAATGYGTFQSHNQRIVSNRNGIFLTYVHWYVDPDSTWHLARSTDGGTIFEVIYERDQHDTSHTSPAMETDEDGNVYLAFADAIQDGFYFLRFLADEDYAVAHETKIEYAPCAAKYTMVYDQPRQRFHVGLQYGGMFSIGRDGVVIDAYHEVYTHGRIAGLTSSPQYPHLHLDSHGTLYYAHTTADVNDVPFSKIYRSILCVKSPDAGMTWQRLDNAPVSIPVRSDEHGDATIITEPQDLEYSTWLASTLTKGGRTHFWYSRRGRATPYVAYNTATGAREQFQDLQHAADSLGIAGSDGFFVTRTRDVHSALYVVSQDSDGRVVCLYTLDNGTTWHDYARAEVAHAPYAVSGSPHVSADGYILGAYTAKTGPDRAPQIWFFKIAALAQ